MLLVPVKHSSITRGIFNIWRSTSHHNKHTISKICKNSMWREFKNTVKLCSWNIHGKESRYAAFWHIVKDPKTYSAFENHICWKEPNEASILPPIQTLHQSWRNAYIRYTSLNRNTSSTNTNRWNEHCHEYFTWIDVPWHSHWPELLHVLLVVPPAHQIQNIRSSCVKRPGSNMWHCMLKRWIHWLSFNFIN